jgi:hypothetical protein
MATSSPENELSAMIRVMIFNDCATMPCNHAPQPCATVRNHDPMVARLQQQNQGLRPSFRRNRNHPRPTSATTATVSIHGADGCGGPGENRISFFTEAETMAESTNTMADEYKVGTCGRLIYLHFGQETEEEKAERQALLLRVADSLGVAVLPPSAQAPTK